jgi:hypothetical protein
MTYQQLRQQDDETFVGTVRQHAVENGKCPDCGHPLSEHGATGCAHEFYNTSKPACACQHAEHHYE